MKRFGAGVSGGEDAGDVSVTIFSGDDVAAFIHIDKGSEWVGGGDAADGYEEAGDGDVGSFAGGVSDFYGGEFAGFFVGEEIGDVDVGDEFDVVFSFD